jgi:probable rRNA maturation factor
MASPPVLRDCAAMTDTALPRHEAGEICIDIDVACDARDVPAEEDLRRWISAALPAGERDFEVSLRIVSEEEIRLLNSTYRHKDYATNVLSFPADLPEELALPLLGDIVVCADVVAREAHEQGKSIAAHWAHMLVHGTLHLLGYDHMNDDEALEMEALETTIITGLGFDPPYETQGSVC